MNAKDLHETYEKAEQDAQKIMADRDDAIQKVRDRFDDRLRKANDKAAKAQKVWLDAQAAEALLDRPDGEAVAQALGLNLSD
jgi:hypothetical protein